MNSSVTLPTSFSKKFTKDSEAKREFLRYTHTHSKKEKFKSSRKGKISMKDSPFETSVRRWWRRRQRKSEKQNITEAKRKVINHDEGERFFVSASHDEKIN
jgi:hypothetical protein